MDEKDFKKHLQDLAHGHHHPEEHDWSTDGSLSKPAASKRGPKRKTAKAAARKTKGRGK
jgi:hypothetical protein